MKFIINILLFSLVLSVPLIAQDSDPEDDPFKRDPIFSKPLDEIFQRTIGQDNDSDTDLSELDQERVRSYVRSINEDGIDFDGALEAGPYHTNPVFSQYPNLPMIHFNRVNGLFLGIKKERMQWHSYSSFFDISGIRPHGFIGVGTASKRWEYAVGLEKLIGESNHVMIGAEFHRGSATTDYWRVGLIESTFTSLFASYDFPDYYLMEGFGAYTAVRSRRYFEAAFSYNIDDFSSLDHQTRFSFFGSPGIYRPNPPIDPVLSSARIQRIEIGGSFNPKKLILRPNFTFTGSLTAEFANNSNFNNDFYYNRYTGELKTYINFEPGSLLKWRVRTGAVTGNAPWFKNFQIGGIGSLRATPYKSLNGNQMFLSNLEIHFGRQRSSSDGWINTDDFHITLFLDSGFSYTNENLQTSNNPFNAFKNYRFRDLTHDAGIGAGSGLIRAELAWPLNNFNRTPAFWIRFNPTF
jgi:hypothetical protein